MDKTCGTCKWGVFQTTRTGLVRKARPGECHWPHTNAKLPNSITRYTDFRTSSVRFNDSGCPTWEQGSAENATKEQP